MSSPEFEHHVFEIMLTFDNPIRNLRIRIVLLYRTEGTCLPVLEASDRWTA
jgi:hypothetical protein